MESTAYISRESALAALDYVKGMVTASNGLKRKEIAAAVESAIRSIPVYEIDTEAHAGVTLKARTTAPMLPFGTVTMPVWVCLHCRGRIGYRDVYCRHCGRKLCGETDLADEEKGEPQ